MKAKLIKQNGIGIQTIDGVDYYLILDGKIYHTNPLTSGLVNGGKLSKQNCDEIFGVVDVEKLADFYGAEANGNIDFKFGANQGFEDGFNKAMELNKDKLFTLEHMRNMMVIGANCEREKGDFTFEFEAYTNHLQQPNEIEVEIVKESIGRVKLGVGSQLEQMMPKLDSDGCLILKKL